MSIGDGGTSQLCLREVDMDLTSMGKLSGSESISCTAAAWLALTVAPAEATGLAKSRSRFMALRAGERVRSHRVWNGPQGGGGHRNRPGGHWEFSLAGNKVGKVVSERLGPACRSLKYSESLREELRSSRSSTLLSEHSKSLSTKQQVWKRATDKNRGGTATALQCQNTIIHTRF